MSLRVRVHVWRDSMPYLMRSVADLWPRSAGLCLSVGFVVDKVALRKHLLPMLLCTLVSIIQPLLKTYLCICQRRCTVLAIQSVITLSTLRLTWTNYWHVRAVAHTDCRHMASWWAQFCNSVGVPRLLHTFLTLGASVLPGHWQGHRHVPKFDLSRLPILISLSRPFVTGTDESGREHVVRESTFPLSSSADHSQLSMIFSVPYGLGLSFSHWPYFMLPKSLFY